MFSGRVSFPAGLVPVQRHHAATHARMHARPRAALAQWHTGTVTLHDTSAQRVTVELTPSGHATPHAPATGLPSARPAEKIAGQRGRRAPRSRKRSTRVTVPEAHVVSLAAPEYWYPALRPVLASDSACLAPREGTYSPTDSEAGSGPPLLQRRRRCDGGAEAEGDAPDAEGGLGPRTKRRRRLSRGEDPPLPPPSCSHEGGQEAVAYVEDDDDDEEEDDDACSTASPRNTFLLHEGCENGPFRMCLQTWVPGPGGAVAAPLHPAQRACTPEDGPPPRSVAPSPPSGPGMPPLAPLPSTIPDAGTPQAEATHGASAPRTWSATPTSVPEGAGSPPTGDPQSSTTPPPMGAPSPEPPAQAPQQAQAQQEAPPPPTTWLGALWRDANTLAAHLVAVRRLHCAGESTARHGSPVTGVLGHDHAGLRPAVGGGGQKRSRGGSALPQPSQRATLLRRLQNRRTMGLAMRRLAAYLAHAQALVGSGGGPPPPAAASTPHASAAGGGGGGTPESDPGLAAVVASSRGGVPAASPVAKALLHNGAELLQLVASATAASEQLLAAAATWGDASATSLTLSIPRGVFAGLTVLHLLLMGQVGMLQPLPLWRAAAWVCNPHTATEPEAGTSRGASPTPQELAHAGGRGVSGTAGVSLRAAAALADHTQNGRVRGQEEEGGTPKSPPSGHLSSVGGAEDVLSALLAALHWCAVSLPPPVLEGALDQHARANHDGVLTCLLDSTSIRQAAVEAPPPDAPQWAAAALPAGVASTGMHVSNTTGLSMATSAHASLTSPGAVASGLGDPLVPSPGSAGADSMGGAGPPTSASHPGGGLVSWAGAQGMSMPDENAIVASAVRQVLGGAVSTTSSPPPAKATTSPALPLSKLSAFMTSPALTAMSEDTGGLDLGPLLPSSALDLGPPMGSTPPTSLWGAGGAF